MIGILLAYLSNYFLLGTGENNWRWMFSSQSAPSLLFFFGLFFVAESPRWLIGKGRNHEARSILERIGGVAYADREVPQIQKSFVRKAREKFQNLFREDVGHIVFIGIIVAIFSQAVGQNSIFSYAPELFKQSGMAKDSAFLQSIILGLINLIFTFIAISTIDKAGRKTLLQYGALLLCIDAIALAVCFYVGAPGYLMLIFLLGFNCYLQCHLSPVTWVILSEIFPNRIRGNALSLATLSLWIANFLLRLLSLF